LGGLTPPPPAAPDADARLGPAGQTREEDAPGGQEKGGERQLVRGGPGRDPRRDLGSDPPAEPARGDTGALGWAVATGPAGIGKGGEVEALPVGPAGLRLLRLQE